MTMFKIDFKLSINTLLQQSKQHTAFWHLSIVPPVWCQNKYKKSRSLWDFSWQIIEARNHTEFNQVAKSCPNFKTAFLHNLVNILLNLLPSVHWDCWLGGRKGIRPVKTEWWGAGVVICLERGGDLHMAQMMPVPLTVSCFSKVQIGFTFLVPAHLGNPGKRAVKRVCVCVCVSFLISLPGVS